jgi:glutamyl-tRNA(Gln) amidotransferase subunit D
MHTSRRDTFKPINSLPIAKIFPNGKIDILREYNKRNKNKVFVEAVFENKIALIKFYPGQNPEILDYYRKKGYKGVIVEFAGIGQILTSGVNNWIPKIKECVSKGMNIYAVPQTLYGRLDPYVYEAGRRLLDAGVVYLEDILPETAFCKLGWVLGHKIWRGSVITPKKMKENLNNEFNEKLGNEFFC